MPTRALLLRWTRPTILFSLFFAFWLGLISLLWREPQILTPILAVIAVLYFAFYVRKMGYSFLRWPPSLGRSARPPSQPRGSGLTTVRLSWAFPTGYHWPGGVTAVAIHKYLEAVARRTQA
jgi:hypothetical protein